MIDFYSLSEFRDLLFHVQEHRFTIPEIKKCMKKFNLSFLGFEDKKIRHKFASEKFDNMDMTDLDKWSEFENSNPDSFRGMYQFWCQKNV